MKNIFASPAALTWPGALRTLRIIGPAVGGILLAIIAIVGLLVMPVTETSADGPNDGHVVVQFGNGGTIGRPISFTTAITGAQALIEAGLEVVTIGSGASTLVCSIEGVGCPAADCFCGCPAPYDPCFFWGQYYQNSGDSDWLTGSGAGVDPIGAGGRMDFPGETRTCLPCGLLPRPYRLWIGCMLNSKMMAVMAARAVPSSLIWRSALMVWRPPAGRRPATR